ARGVETRGLIRYSPVNGGAWIPFGSGFSAGIRTAGLVAGELVVAGPFQRVGDVSAPGLARWDGRVWHAVAPEEAPITAYAIAEHGDQLYAGGVRDPHTSSASASLVRL